MEIRLVLTAFIVLSFRLIHGEPTNQEGHSKVQDNLRDLFDSINNNNARKTKDVRNILGREAAREQQVFDTVKEDLRLTRQRNAHKQKDIEHKMALKREAPKTPKGPEPPDASYDRVAHIQKNVAQEFPPKYWFGRWETIPLTDNLAPYIQAKEKFHLAYPQNEEAFRMKTRVCMGIVSSEHMEVHHNVKALDIHEEADFDEINLHYPKIFNRSFKKWSLFQKQVELENPYRLRDVIIGNETANVHPREYDRNAVYGLPEYVFACLAKRIDSEKYVEYLISQEYPIPTSEPYGPTRFIFKHADDAGTRIIPVGVSRLPNAAAASTPTTPLTTTGSSASEE